MPVTAEPADASSPHVQRADRPRSLREFERAIRDLGFSQREAKVIAARGFAALADLSTTDDGEQQFAEVFGAALRRLAG